MQGQHRVMDPITDQVFLIEVKRFNDKKCNFVEKQVEARHGMCGQGETESRKWGNNLGEMGNGVQGEWLASAA